MSNTTKKETIVTIDHAELIALLSAKSGVSFSSMEVTTDPANRGGKAAKGRATKTVSILWVGGASYENAINKAVEREGETGDFKAKGMHNGKTRRINSFLSYNSNNDNYLLKVLCRVGETVYANIGDATYTLDGKPSSKAELISKGLRAPDRAAYVANTGTKAEIETVFVAYGTRGITKIRMNGTTYKVK
jgi:hypothetical protein